MQEERLLAGEGASALAASLLPIAQEAGTQVCSCPLHTLTAFQSLLVPCFCKAIKLGNTLCSMLLHRHMVMHNSVLKVPFILDVQIKFDGFVCMLNDYTSKIPCLACGPCPPRILCPQQQSCRIFCCYMPFLWCPSDNLLAHAGSCVVSSITSGQQHLCSLVASQTTA